MFLTLEATGTNISTDRIVESSIVKLHPDGEQEIIYQPGKIPTVPIPRKFLDSRDYDKDIRRQNQLSRTCLEGLFNFRGQSDLSGVKCLKYDIPLFSGGNFLRSGIDLILIKRNLLDSQKNLSH